MFESLKRKMILDESKEVSKKALELICEDMSFDESMESILFTESGSEDDSEIEKLVDELPDDELGDDEMEDDDEFLEEEMSLLESFLDDEDCQTEGVNTSPDLDEDELHEGISASAVASANSPYSYGSEDLDLDI
jgi:hypothetical protein